MGMVRHRPPERDVERLLDVFSDMLGCYSAKSRLLVAAATPNIQIACYLISDAVLGRWGGVGVRAGDGAGGGAVAAATGRVRSLEPPRASAALGAGVSQHLWAGDAGSSVIWCISPL